MQGEEEMRSEWQTGGHAQGIKLIKAEKLKCDRRRVCQWYGRIGGLRSHTLQPQLRGVAAVIRF